MSDPAFTTIEHGTEGWDSPLNDNFTLVDANFVRSTKSADHGAKTIFEHVEAESPALAAPSYAFANLIPAGAVVIGVSARVTVLMTGATTWKLGDGTTTDLFAAAKALIAGTTSDMTDHKAGSWTGPKPYMTANDVVVTANGADFTAGKLRVTVHYMKISAPTS